MELEVVAFASLVRALGGWLNDIGIHYWNLGTYLHDNLLLIVVARFAPVSPVAQQSRCAPTLARRKDFGTILPLGPLAQFGRAVDS